MKFTGINLQKLQDKDKILLIEKNFRGPVISAMGDMYVKSEENEKVFYLEANNLYGWAISESLPYDKFQFDSFGNLEAIIYTPDDSDNGYSLHADLKCPDEIKPKPKNFLFCPENKSDPQDKFSEYMNQMEPNTYTQEKISMWLD